VRLTRWRSERRESNLILIFLYISAAGSGAWSIDGVISRTKRDS
jgi:hypothetical protein